MSTAIIRTKFLITGLTRVSLLTEARLFNAHTMHTRRIALCFLDTTRGTCISRVTFTVTSLRVMLLANSVARTRVVTRTFEISAIVSTPSRFAHANSRLNITCSTLQLRVAIVAADLLFTSITLKSALADARTVAAVTSVRTVRITRFHSARRTFPRFIAHTCSVQAITS